MFALAFAASAASPEDLKRRLPACDDPANLVDSIVARYPGQTVLVDFWATWCGPCLDAIKAIEPLRPWMDENGIVRVYIILPKVHAGRYNRMIPNIGGEHYELTEEERDAVCERYGFKEIPYYRIYNREGRPTYEKKGAYPGNETIKAELEKAM